MHRYVSVIKLSVHFAGTVLISLFYFTHLTRASSSFSSSPRLLSVLSSPPLKSIFYTNPSTICCWNHVYCCSLSLSWSPPAFVECTLNNYDLVGPHNSALLHIYIYASLFRQKQAIKK